MTFRTQFAVTAFVALALATTVLAQDGGRRNGARIRFGGDYTLGQGEVVRGPILVIGGTARIDGVVDDDVIVIGGRAEIGPTAIINGDVRSIAGSLSIADGAQLGGGVDEVVGDAFPIDFGDAPRRMWAWLAAWLTVLRLSFVFVAGLLLAMLGPYWMQSIGIRVSHAPGWSLVVGIATEVLITPAVLALSIALIITIVGIPLLAGIPVLLAVLALLWIAGFTAVAVRVGGALRGGRDDAPVRQFLLGFLALCGVSLVAQMLSLVPGAGALAIGLGGVGVLVEYVAWTLGLGAALLTAFNRHGAAVPPPLPPQATPQYVP
ncbi:MAG: hypothetical protein AB7P99_00680 [Vicinamibacterales bacterium]